MSLDKQANQAQDPKIDTSSDSMIQRAIEQGEQNVKNSESEEEKITIELTKVDEQKLRKLMSRLALSRETMVESAISLVHDYVVKEKQNSVDKLEEKFIVNGNREKNENQKIELSLSVEAQKKLKELNMNDDKVEHCARIGINLHYDALQRLYTQNNNPENND